MCIRTGDAFAELGCDRSPWPVACGPPSGHPCPSHLPRKQLTGPHPVGFSHALTHRWICAARKRQNKPRPPPCPQRHVACLTPRHNRLCRPLSEKVSPIAAPSPPIQSPRRSSDAPRPDPPHTSITLKQTKTLRCVAPAHSLSHSLSPSPSSPLAKKKLADTHEKPSTASLMISPGRRQGFWPRPLCSRTPETRVPKKLDMPEIHVCTIHMWANSSSCVLPLCYEMNKYTRVSTAWCHTKFSRPCLDKVVVPPALCDQMIKSKRANIVRSMVSTKTAAHAGTELPEG